MFFEFHQNNSGGHFEGPTIVIVEADSAREANNLAEDANLYFDGVAKGLDCECCGDRWYRVWNEDGTEEPEIYGNPIKEYLDKETKQCVVYFKDGRVRNYG